MKNLLIGIAVLVVVVWGGWMILADKPIETAGVQEETASTEIEVETFQIASTTPVTTSKNMAVKYTAAGFEPKTVNIKVGDSVSWTNETTHGMWVGSANHPDHTKYDGTNTSEHCANPTTTTFDQCKSGASYTFTFTKAGSWNYHDHVTAGNFGTVVVTQ